MATQPTSPLPEDQKLPPGTPPDKEQPPITEQEQTEVTEQEPEPQAEADGPQEGEPEAAEQEPAEEGQEQEFVPDPNFLKKFAGKDGQIDLRKVHDSYLAAERKLSEPKIKPDEIKRIEQEAELGRQAAYLAQKYPDLPLRKAYEREVAAQQQAAMRPATGVPVQYVEELTDDQVDEQASALIARGEHVKAQQLVARHTPEMRKFRAWERQQAEEQARAQRAAYERKMATYDQQLDELKSKNGNIPDEVWGEIQKAIRGIPVRDQYGNDVEIDMEAIYELAVRRAKKASPPTAKKPSALPSGRQPKPTPPAPKPVRRDAADHEYLTSKRLPTLEEVMKKGK